MIELKFHKQHPFNTHVRICKYCGDSFIANHGLRQFCSSKFGRANYCKHQHKVLLSEKRQIDPEFDEEEKPIVEDPKEKRIRILNEVMAFSTNKLVSSDLLDATAFDLNELNEFWRTDEGLAIGIIGQYTIEEQKEKIGPFKIYKITKYPGRLLD